MIRRIKVCLNGGRSRADHPAVPVTAVELGVAAAGAVAAGAEAIHMHPRDGDGVESLDADDIAAAVTAVRAAGVEVPVGVSTGLWITDHDVERRRAAVAHWAALPSSARPDFASVNVGEPGFAELVEVLRAAGIGLEAGVWSTSDAKALAAVDTAGWTRVLVEIIGGSAEAAAGEADAVLARLDELGVAGPRLLHGEEAACWPLVVHAGRLGLPTRIGFEDTTVGPDGDAVTDNADLVRRAVARWTAAAPDEKG